MAPAYVPPISVILASARERYIRGLTDYREDRTDLWIESFSVAALRSARLATDYLAAVDGLVHDWRAQLTASPKAPRAGATAWAIIDQLPHAHIEVC